MTSLFGDKPNGEVLYADIRGDKLIKHGRHGGWGDLSHSSTNGIYIGGPEELESVLHAINNAFGKRFRIVERTQITFKEESHGGIVDSEGGSWGQLSSFEPQRYLQQIRQQFEDKAKELDAAEALCKFSTDRKKELEEQTLSDTLESMGLTEEVLEGAGPDVTKMLLLMIAELQANN